ncbi:histidine phosphatase family protein [Filobacillus milosensis]|uniref:Histidine phosphatase family protein n=1 Tax=Filobacillus milosensis TaxID=94137 RepID=A0A4Y8IEA7_9BACI|nr:histidine phosphatase family protein [Filobacillus milosensis]TFB13464.1 histidine phosphatase family protein [Filobacillus milosensis]
MELVFIRHGQGEHTVDLPQSLHISDPALTNEGKLQAMSLRNQFPLSQNDVVIISPLRRTLQTAHIWSEGINCRKIVSPFVSPRMFPQTPQSTTLPCDELLTKEKIKNVFNDFCIDGELPDEYWLSGINKTHEQEFSKIASRYLTWCKSTGKKRIYIVSHDGTITSYNQFITGRKLSRKDFPKETGWLKIDC